MDVADSPMQTSHLYKNAHLIIAAVRILEHRDQAPPTIENVCQALSFSVERGNHICQKLQALGAVDIVEGAYGTRLFIKDHRLLENLPQQVDENDLSADLKKFKDSKKNFEKEIESRRTAQKERKKNLFAEIEDKLRKGLNDG